MDKELSSGHGSLLLYVVDMADSFRLPTTEAVAKASPDLMQVNILAASVSDAVG